MNEIVEIHKKMFYYLDTFMSNSGRDKAKNIILDALKKDAVESKMQNMRFNNTRKPVKSYEEQAREYYNRWGTSGEF